MAYESYKLLHSSTSSIKNKMLEDKKKQIQFLYNHAVDREEHCTINGRQFVESPRLFDRTIKTNYFQTLTCETVNELDRFNSGNLLEFDNDNWICTSSFVFHELYCKGNFIRCNYILKWQDTDGSVIERPCLVQSAAQYNSGERGNQTITLGTDQLMIVLPNDEKTNLIDTPQSFFVDKNTAKPTPYKVTRNDTVPYSDWDEGCINLIVTQRETSDKDRPDLMLCDYIEIFTSALPTPSEADETTVLNATIIGNKNLKVGFSRIYTVNFTDKNENEIDWNSVDFRWNISSDFSDKIVQKIDGNKIKLLVKDDSLIDESFLLQILMFGIITTEINVNIVEGW